MNSLPDAPWIRDAEQNGVDDGDDVICPCCGAENPDSFYIEGGEVVGCSHCLKCVDPWEWIADHKEEDEE